jgi:hypothetical protein
MKIKHMVKRWHIEKRLRDHGSRMASVATEYARMVTSRRRKKAFRRNAGRIASWVAAFGGAVVGFRTWRAMRAH